MGKKDILESFKLEETQLFELAYGKLFIELDDEYENNIGMNEKGI